MPERPAAMAFIGVLIIIAVGSFAFTITAPFYEELTERSDNIEVENTTLNQQTQQGHAWISDAYGAWPLYVVVVPSIFILVYTVFLQEGGL